MRPACSKRNLRPPVETAEGDRQASADAIDVPAMLAPKIE